ncbi:MAG: hypothetical protein ABWY05_09970 [Noviherbaspirillum sp.]
MNARAPRVVLFSGHMIDRPDRQAERFPADMTPLAQAEIGARLARLGVGSDDLAMCEGACGGDLLFAEAVLARGMRLELRLPFDEARFLRESVGFAGDAWLARYARVRSDPRTTLYCMPPGAAPPGCDAFEQANLWQLNAALAHGADQVWLLALWDGQRSGSPGGTDHLVQTVNRHAGQVIIIDAAALLRQTVERRLH